MIRICYQNRPGLGALTEKGNLGGGQLQTLREAIELAKDKKFDVHMIVEGNEYSTFKHKGITAWVFPKINILNDIIQTYKHFKRINADIYLGRMVTRLQIFYEPFFCRILGKKYVYHEIGDPSSILEKKFPQLQKFAYSTALELVSAITAISQKSKKNLRLFTKKPIQIINLPIYFKNKLKQKREHILWVGNFHKRPELFVKLAKEFPKEHFLMILPKKISRIPSNLEVKSNIPHEDMDKYYATAKILVHTSEREGFPNVFLEAWRNKTPIVSFGVDPDNTLKNYRTGFYSETFEGMIRKIKLLLNDKKTWKQFSENGYKYVKQNHNIEKIMKEYKELFFVLKSSK